MKSPPFISVVITCYNYARYIGAAIDSALSQSYPRKEVIVVDDGSTDESGTIIASYGAKVRAFEQRNQGHIAACNRGFSLVRGDVVMFLDADDVLEAGALARVAEVWTPGCSKIQFELRIIDALGDDMGRRFCNFPSHYGSEQVRKEFSQTGTYRWPVTTGNAYARSFLEPMFPLEIERAPDGYLNTVAPVYGDVVTIAEVLGSYRVHGNNLWSTGGLSRLPERIQGRYREVEFMRRHAAQRGISVPACNVLDHELAFLNYRLMSLRLGLEYEGHQTDRASALLFAAYRLLGRQRIPSRIAAAHVAWFSTLAIAPRAVAKALIELRLEESALGQRINQARRALAV